MRDPGRIAPMLDRLQRIWTQYPDFRLGQIIENAAEMSGHPRNQRDLFYLEDDRLAEGLLILEETLGYEKNLER